MSYAVDHKGNKYVSITQMCESYHISNSLFSHRIAKGYSLEEALEGKNTVYDYKGNKYKNLKEMCNHYSITVSLYNSRKYKGIEGEQLFSKTKIKKRGNKEVKDHLGNTFVSTSAMCDYYNINRSTYTQRINKGMTVEEALTSNQLKRQAKIKKGEVTDHLGNKYTTVKEMCAFYNIKYITYAMRIKNGWSLEKTLTTIPLTRQQSIQRDS